MKIVFLVNTMGKGGAERVAATLSNHWVRRGWDVCLVTTYTRNDPSAYPLEAAVRLVSLADLAPSARKGVRGYLPRLLALRRLIAKESPDVVLSFLTNVNFAGILATRGLGIPVIVSERFSLEADTSIGRSILRRLLYPFASVVVVQTDAAARLIRRLVPKLRQVEVVENPVPQELSAAIRPSRSGARRRIAGFGRLTAVKRFDQLIDIFSRLAPRFPDVDLWIWGEGEDRLALEAQGRKLGLSSRVFLPGRTDDPWVEMLASDVLALTSAYEGFPNVLLEAMALGVPCVAYDCPEGPRDLTSDGQLAPLIPPGDQEAMYRQLSEMLENPACAQDRARKSSITIRTRYSLEQIILKWDKVLSSTK